MICPRAQRIPDHPFEAANCRFGNSNAIDKNVWLLCQKRLVSSQWPCWIAGRFVTAVAKRPAKWPKGTKIGARLRWPIRRIRVHWPNTGILLRRANGHFCGPLVTDWCRANSIDFILGCGGSLYPPLAHCRLGGECRSELRCGYPASQEPAQAHHRLC